MSFEIVLTLEDELLEGLKTIAEKEKCTIEEAGGLIIKKYIKKAAFSKEEEIYKPKLRLIDILTKEEKDEVERLTKCLEIAKSNKTIKYYGQEIRRILYGAKERYKVYKSKKKESD